MPENIAHIENLNLKKVKIINIITLLLGLCTGLMSFVGSSYFKEASGDENISFYYIVINIILFLILINFHKLVNKIGRLKLFLYFASLFLFTSLMLLLLQVSWWGLVFLMFNIIFFKSSFVAKDMILESYSSDKMSGRIRGMHIIIIHVGFILGVILSTQMLEHYSWNSIFLIQLITIALLLYIAKFKLKAIKHETRETLTIMKIIEIIKHRKNVLRIYCVAVITEFFYFIMSVYVPIHMRNMGIPWGDMGIVFIIMLAPWLFIPEIVGNLADKKWGEKEMIIASIIITALSVAGIFFIQSTSLLIWAMVLIFTRFGTAILCTAHDSYFYKRIDSRDVHIIEFFRTSLSVGYIIGAVLTGVFLWLFDLPKLFLFAGAIILLALFPAAQLIDNKSERELAK